MTLEPFSQIKHGSNAKPLLCLEVNPPRGIEVESIFKRLEGQLEGVDFFNVTDSALAKMKFAALPFASLLKQRFGIEPLVNISCRDRNLIAIQGDLLAGWVTGVRSIVALTGDAVTIGDSPERKGVFEVNSLGLLSVVQALNQGQDISGNALKGIPQFIPGAVVNPNARNPSAEIKRLKRKKDAGAQYALSQPVFDEEVSVNFFREAYTVGIPLFVGLLPLKSLKSAEAINKVPGIKVSEKLMARITAMGDKDLSEFFIDFCMNLAKLNQPYVCGFHVISGTTPLLSLALTRALAAYIKTC